MDLAHFPRLMPANAESWHCDAPLGDNFLVCTPNSISSSAPPGVDLYAHHVGNVGSGILVTYMEALIGTIVTPSNLSKYSIQ